MTPAARVQAAIEVLDVYLAGRPLEQALTNWARGHRFAGSGDRAAIRDHVFDAVRRRRSLAALGGALSGRGLMLGALRARGTDPTTVFSQDRHAPAPLSPSEAQAGSPAEKLSDLDALDCPDWIADRLRSDLGGDFKPVLRALQARAPVFLRVNTIKATPDDAIAALASDEITAVPHPLAATALEVTGNPRRVRNAMAFRDGLVELQDAASQAVIAALPTLAPGARLLDYCAGGGGKALALAARYGRAVTAHDADPGRMADIPARAARAGATIEIAPPQAVSGRFDMVLCDVPCSGTGAWRRQPEAKWRLDAAALETLIRTQDAILDAAAPLVAPGGALAYATCSILSAENRGRIDAFLERHGDWTDVQHRRWLPTEGGDGFGLSILTR